MPVLFITGSRNLTTGSVPAAIIGISEQRMSLSRAIFMTLVRKDGAFLLFQNYPHWLTVTTPTL